MRRQAQLFWTARVDHSSNFTKAYGAYRSMLTKRKLKQIEMSNQHRWFHSESRAHNLMLHDDYRLSERTSVYY